jgi:S1-C subfamily serine protease
VAYLPPQGTGAVSIGFAIPVSTVVDVVEELATTGRAVHAFAGVQLAPVTPRLAEAYGLPERGAVVLEVVPDSPASAAGLEGGDVVVGVDGSDVAGPETVLTAIRRSEPGDRLELRVRAPGGEERTVVLELAERPPPEPAP